jgi:hypothetical protein
LKGKSEREAKTRAAMKGLGIRVASIACRVPFDLFPPGCRVSVELPETEMTWCDGPCPDYYERHYSVVVPGTIMGRAERKIRLWLDEKTDSGKSPIIRVYPDRLTKLDEPPISVCSECGRPENQPETRQPEGRKWSCWKCEGFASWDDQLRDRP